MPAVAGSLRDRLNKEGTLAIDVALRIAQQIAEALACAHGEHLIHRDVKPENILLDGDHAYLADFGVAKALSQVSVEITSAGLAVGTPAYMSPEQGAGNHGRIDARSDVYSLGCVLYEMLAGEPPFTGPTSQAIIARHQVEPPRSLRVVRPTISPALEALVMRALAKGPGRPLHFGDRVRRRSESASHGCAGICDLCRGYSGNTRHTPPLQVVGHARGLAVAPGRTGGVGGTARGDVHTAVVFASNCTRLDPLRGPAICLRQRCGHAQ
jgi:serine/threonine protein kinase